MKSKKILFIALFAILGFIALQIPVTQVIGTKAKFTLFDAFGPTATAFIGTGPGILAVFIMKLADFVWHGAAATDIGTLLRFIPILFGAFYFGKKYRFSWAVAALAIIVWNAHPIGRSVWYFSLFWIIPIAMHPVRDRFLLARALGATFTQHAVGGALWIWVFALPAPVWNGLIPVVAVERALFAVGIAVSYVALNHLLSYATSRRPSLAALVTVDQRYVWIGR